jgi:uncharacterized membrane protein (UPF0136 family)
LPSLIAGGGFGILTMASAIAILKRQFLGIPAALLLSGFLTLFFGYRLYLTHSFMPAGLMTILSIAVLSILMFYKNQPEYKKL